MGHRMQRLVTEAGKFIAVGGVATVIAVVLFNVLVHGLPGGEDGLMHDQPLPAYAVANLVGMVVSYRGSRSWAFRHREPVGVAGGRLAFFVVNLVSMLIPLACLSVSRYLLDLDTGLADNISANVIGLALGTILRFWLFRKFVFLRPEKAARQRAGAE